MVQRLHPLLELAERDAASSMVVASGGAAPLILPADGSVSDAFAQVLVDLGVEFAFGLFGGAVAPFCEALNRSSIHIVHFRHEAGAAFAAIEASIATGKPVVVFATTGPGLTNTITGMHAARWEGAKVIFVSGATPAAQRGRWAFQETSGYTMPVSGLFTAGPIFHQATMMESPAELDVIASRLASGVRRPGGFVAHLGIPIAVQTAPANGTPRLRSSSVPPTCDEATAEECVRMLTSGRFVIWAGFGARGAAEEIMTLAEHTGARVMCSPRGKGIFPEDHPQYLGVTGLGGHPAVDKYMTEERPARVLVLGSRLGEFTSFYAPELVPPAGFIHVDVDAEVFGTAYPSATTFGVTSEIKTFLNTILDLWPTPIPPPRLSLVREDRKATQIDPRYDGVVRPSYLMQEIQREIVEATEAIVITEAGNSFALGSHHLHFATPGRYRVSAGFGSMGHAVGGVVGAALATNSKAVAITGDGSMLMLSEVNTAVACGAKAVWIVLNDARYGMIHQGMRSISWEPFETEFPRADFVQIARGMGADGVRVEREEELAMALARAMEAEGPFVVDVIIDPEEVAPATRRNQSLIKQGVSGIPRSGR